MTKPSHWQKKTKGNAFGFYIINGKTEGERERPRLVKEPLAFPGKCKGKSVSVYVGSLYPLIVMPHRLW